MTFSGVQQTARVRDVILPFVVLRRLDCVLEAKKDHVLENYNKFKKTLPDVHKVLLKASGLNFYNTSRYDLDRLSQDNKNLELNFNNYVNGFSDNVREILENFQLEKIIEKLKKLLLCRYICQTFKPG